jgi:tRNA (guanine37-N1)-methyltransferase
MIFHVLTVFPELVRTVFNYGVLRRAVESGLVGHDVRDLRNWTDDPHRSTDDRPMAAGRAW